MFECCSCFDVAICTSTIRSNNSTRGAWVGFLIWACARIPLRLLLKMSAWRKNRRTWQRIWKPGDSVQHWDSRRPGTVRYVTADKKFMVIYFPDQGGVEEFRRCSAFVQPSDWEAFELRMTMLGIFVSIASFLCNQTSLKHVCLTCHLSHWSCGDKRCSHRLWYPRVLACGLIVVGLFGSCRLKA
jgi:hypothetical protein